MNTISPIIFALIPSGMEWLWIVLIVLLLFGGAKLPALARGLGQSIREFKKATSEDDKDDDKNDTDTKKPAKKKVADDASTSNGSN